MRRRRNQNDKKAVTQRVAMGNRRGTPMLNAWIISWGRARGGAHIVGGQVVMGLRGQ